MDQIIKGFTADIYRGTFKDSFSKLKAADRVTIVDQTLPALFVANEEYPAVKIVRRNLWGKEYIHAEPLEPGNYAASGSFIYTSDSRLREIAQYPIPLHDRQMDLEKSY